MAIIRPISVPPRPRRSKARLFAEEFVDEAVDGLVLWALFCLAVTVITIEEIAHWLGSVGE